MKIKSKYANLVSTTLISVSMSLSISFIMSFIYKVPADEFVFSWLRSSAIGTVIGIPLALVYVPNILKAVENMQEDEEDESKES